MISSTPSLREPDLRLNLDSKLAETIEYLREQAGGGAGSSLGRYATWRAHGYCHACIRALDEGDEVAFKTLLGRAASGFSATKAPLAVDYLVDDDDGRDAMFLLNGELRGHTDREIGVAFVPTDVSSKDHEITKVREGIEILAALAPNFHSELVVLVDQILLSGDNGSIHIRSASSFNLFGLITMWVDATHSSIYYLEQIVHETGHLRLFIESVADELVLNAPEERYRAPFRDDARPMLGIFHAMFVLCRTAVALRLVHAGNKDPAKAADIEKKLRRAEQRYFTTAEEVRSNGVLTVRGKAVFDSCWTEMAGCLSTEGSSSNSVPQAVLA